MVIVSSRDFKSKMKDYLTMAANMEVILMSEEGNYRLVPVESNVSPLKARIEESRKNLAEGNVTIVSSGAELDEIIRAECTE